MAKKSTDVIVIEGFNMFGGEVDPTELESFEDRTAKVAAEIVDFVRANWAPWINVAKGSNGKKLVRIPRCVPTSVSVPRTDATGAPVFVPMKDEDGNIVKDRNGKTRFTKTQIIDTRTAEDLASKFQVALRASANADEDGNWLVRTKSAAPTDKGWVDGTDQSVFLICLGPKGKTADEAEASARQAERAEVIAAAKNSDTGKAHNARKAS